MVDSRSRIQTSVFYLMNTQSLIREFLQQRRFAFIGVSRDPKSFSRTLFREFLHQGFDPIPVNPFANEIEGKRCVAAVHLIDPPVAAAFIITSPETIKSRMRECSKTGVTLAWIYGIKGPGEIPHEALHIGEQYGIGMIAGYCPYMFFQNTAWFHRLHTSVWKLVGLYPKE
jgi:predicted CoA-binding protein